MDEIKKMDFGASTRMERKTTMSTKSSHTRFGKNRKILLGIVAILVVLGLFTVFGIVLPARKVYTSAMATKAQAQIAYASIKTQNIAAASDDLAKTRASLQQTQKDLHAMAYVKFIPLVNGYYNDADHLINAGFDGIDAGTILLDSLKPYADVLGLKGQGSFVMGSAEQRIQTAVLTMGKITPRIDDIAVKLQDARKEIDQVDPNHYPDFGPGKKVHTQLAQLKTLVDEGGVFVEEARPLIKVLPSLLGESKEKKYLVLFQNDKELRPTGGFITAYAIFSIDKGIIHVDKSDDIYNLDATVKGKQRAMYPLTAYLPDVPLFNLRDANLSADYVASMKTFMNMYNNSSEAVPVDGVIAIDTNVLVSTIKILDDEIQAGGMTFTTKNEPACDCPQVIYALENNITRPVNYQKTERKAIL